MTNQQWSPAALAHELFTAAQLAPGEGIENAVGRLAALVEAQQPAQPRKEPGMADAFIDLRELDANTLRDISVKSGVIWPEDGDRESRLFRFRVRRIATEAYRRGVADGQKINAAVAVMFGEQPHE